MSLTHQRADATLNAALRPPATPHLWLHTGNPGVAGTANVAQDSAANIVRKPITFLAPVNHPIANERMVENDASVVWSGTEIDVGQNITHISIWSALTAGSPEVISAVAVPKITGSDGAMIPVGEIEISIGVFVKP